MKFTIISNTVYFALIVTFCCMLTTLGFSQKYPSIVAIITMISTAILVCSYSLNVVQTKNDVSILAISFILKLSYMLCRIYDKFGANITNPTLTSDARRFWDFALSLYQGNAVQPDTHFPYVLNAEFHVFGPNILCVLLINIFLTMLMAVVVLKFLNKYEVSGKHRIIALAVCTLLPYEIIVSCSLLRESIYFIFIVLSFDFYQNYIEKDNYKYLLLAMFMIIPVSFLHTGYFSIIIVYFLDSLRHDNPKTGKQLFMRIILIILLLSLLILEIRMDANGGNYVSRGVSGVINKVTGESGSSYSDEAGSRYLMGLTINSIPTLIIFTPIRSFYFMFSPLPTNWRGLSDIIAFLADSCVHFYVILYTIKARKILKRIKRYTSNIYGQNYRVLSVGLFIVIFVAFVFCLNTNNAGTAIRHRVVLIGIEAVMLGLSLKICSSYYNT